MAKPLRMAFFSGVCLLFALLAFLPAAEEAIERQCREEGGKYQEVDGYWSGTNWVAIYGCTG